MWNVVDEHNNLNEWFNKLLLLIKINHYYGKIDVYTQKMDNRKYHTDLFIRQILVFLLTKLVSYHCIFLVLLCKPSLA